MRSLLDKDSTTEAGTSFNNRNYRHYKNKEREDRGQYQNIRQFPFLTLGLCSLPDRDPAHNIPSASSLTLPSPIRIPFTLTNNAGWGWEGQREGSEVKSSCCSCRGPACRCMWRTTTSNSSPRGFSALFQLLWVPGTHTEHKTHSHLEDKIHKSFFN